MRGSPHSALHWEKCRRLPQAPPRSVHDRARQEALQGSGLAKGAAASQLCVRPPPALPQTCLQTPSRNPTVRVLGSPLLPWAAGTLPGTPGGPGSCVTQALPGGRAGPGRHGCCPSTAPAPTSPLIPPQHTTSTERSPKINPVWPAGSPLLPHVTIQLVPTSPLYMGTLSCGHLCPAAVALVSTRGPVGSPGLTCRRQPCSSKVGPAVCAGRVPSGPLWLAFPSGSAVCSVQGSTSKSLVGCVDVHRVPSLTDILRTEPGHHSSGLG